MAHNTGGGLPENLERLLGEKGAAISIPRWELGAVGRILSFVEDAEAIKTFNMGWGWIVVLSAAEAEAAASFHEGARVIGEVNDSGTVEVEIDS
jgi:phosphoribosylformylglycinamidine cyclo-ligase